MHRHENKKFNPYIEVERLEDLPASEEGLVCHYAFQYLDFTKAEDYAISNHFCDCIFMGCEMPEAMPRRMCENCLIFPRMGMVFKAFANCLYTGETLYEGYDPDDESTYGQCFDQRVYKDYLECGKKAWDIRVTLARSIHDHAMGDAMHDLLAEYGEGNTIAIMGGHAMKRTEESYAKIARISKRLTEHGKLMISGGGPGAMEATHLGAWMAGRSDEEFERALAIMAEAPTFRDAGWLSTSFKVMKEFPQTTYRSLGVPTWLYGHEPSTPLATDIAKYFENSIREDSLLSIATGGVIYSPGSAGTMQEIFQDAAQNHYESCGYASPMVFLGVDFYTKELPVYPFLQSLVEKGKYQNLILSITDSIDEVVTALV